MTSVIQTITSIINLPLNVINIFTQYINNGSIIYAFISNYVGSINSVPFKEGELIVTKNDPLLNIYLNANGELIINSQDANKYSINLNGELTYTE